MFSKSFRAPYSTINCGAFYVEVQEVPREELPDKIKNFIQPDNLWYGFFIPEELLIIINKDLPEDLKRTSLWHELKHVVMFITADDEPSFMYEEAYISRSSMLEVQLLVNNHALANYLADMLGV